MSKKKKRWETEELEQTNATVICRSSQAVILFCFLYFFTCAL